MADDWECADCCEDYATCQCWNNGTVLETLKHQLNWIYDFSFGNTEMPPLNRDWDELQLRIHNDTGKYWNPCTAQLIDEPKPNPWNLPKEKWDVHYPEAFDRSLIDGDIENGPDLHCWEGPAPEQGPDIAWFK